MSDNYSVKEVVEEVKDHLKEIKADVKETKGKVEYQNGRVRLIEDWANDVKVLLENHTKGISSLKTSRTKIMTVIAVLVVVGGTMITLSVMAINQKIEKGIKDRVITKEEIQEIVLDRDEVKQIVSEVLEEKAEVYYNPNE